MILLCNFNENCVIGGMNAIGFLACGILCKICNHPSLIYDAAAEMAGAYHPRSVMDMASSKRAATTAPLRRSSRSTTKAKTRSSSASRKSSGKRNKVELEGLYEIFPDGYYSDGNPLSPSHSTKCAFVMKFLTNLKKECDDKVVIVSVYVETLNLLSKMLDAVSIGYLRLDGSVPTKKRQQFVDQFNDPKEPYMVLLLSNRAGGCGLNLIGANRLIMFDPDWNPANDAQAMARVWRSGQKKPTFIYRLLSTGAIEEKMFQRQTFKSDMAEQIVADECGDVTEFAVKELKAIFEYNEKTKCDTLDRLKGTKGFSSWDRHTSCFNVGDPMLYQPSKGAVTYLLKRIINDEKDKKRMKIEREKAEKEKREASLKPKPRPKPKVKAKPKPRALPKKTSRVVKKKKIRIVEESEEDDDDEDESESDNDSGSDSDIEIVTAKKKKNDDSSSSADEDDEDGDESALSSVRESESQSESDIDLDQDDASSSVSSSSSDKENRRLGRKRSRRRS